MIGVRQIADLCRVRGYYGLTVAAIMERDPEVAALTRQWIEERVDRPHGLRGCWHWLGPVRRGLYGTYGVTRFGGRLQQAHRVVYEALVGVIPSKLVLDHLCRNTLCVNPTHLEPVTAGENMKRGTSPTANAVWQNACTRGHPFDEANTYVWTPTGQRKCRRCGAEYAAAWRKANPDRFAANVAAAKLRKRKWLEDDIAAAGLTRRLQQRAQQQRAG